MNKRTERGNGSRQVSEVESQRTNMLAEYLARVREARARLRNAEAAYEAAKAAAKAAKETMAAAKAELDRQLDYELEEMPLLANLGGDGYDEER